MDANKRINSIPTVMIFLLLTQVVLSAGIVIKLNNLEQGALFARGSTTQNISIPEYQEGISIDNHPSFGISGAPITLIEFSDYECPFCAEAVSVVETIMSEYKGKVLFVYRNFPLESIHSNAFRSAEAAQCAGDQKKFWEMHNLLFRNQSRLESDNLKEYASQLHLDMQLFIDCLDNGKHAEQIRRDVIEGKSHGVMSTPTFFVNGHRIVGASLDQLRTRIDSIIQGGQ